MNYIAQRCLREGYPPEKIVDFLIQIGAAESEMSARRLVANARADIRRDSFWLKVLSVWLKLLSVPVLLIILYIGYIAAKAFFILILLIINIIILFVFGVDIGLPPFLR